MCGIVGAIAERNVSGILLEGLKRLEYRGYDSVGISTIENKDKIIRNLETEASILGHQVLTLEKEKSNLTIKGDLIKSESFVLNV